MKKEILSYLIGMTQAAAAALLASAVIMPSARMESVLACHAAALVGVLLVILKNRGN